MDRTLHLRALRHKQVGPYWPQVKPGVARRHHRAARGVPEVGQDGGGERASLVCLVCLSLCLASVSPSRPLAPSYECYECYSTGPNGPMPDRTETQHVRAHRT